MAEKKKIIKRYISKKMLMTLLIIMWGGVGLCIISWLPSFTIFGIPSQAIGLPGGVMAIAGVILLLFLPKCPYCGSHKLGKAIGTKIVKDVECPACNKKVGIR